MSKTIEALDQRAHDAAPGSMRQTVLFAAKKFKSSWAELGKLLVQVRDQALFEQWGFPSFEAYCLKELHIRKATADKLTRSFSFLQRHEPQEIEHEEFPQRAPAFEVVEVLADAESRGQLTPSEYKSVRDSIWNAERPVAELKRELVERFPKPPPEPPPDDLQLRRLAAAARKLANDLAASSRVPSAISDRASALADDVEELASANKGE